MRAVPISFFFFFNDTATTEIYTLSLHDALPIFERRAGQGRGTAMSPHPVSPFSRSEEHTFELQSRLHLVCRLLLEKKKKDLNTYSLRVGIVLCTHRAPSDVLLDSCRGNGRHCAN